MIKPAIVLFVIAVVASATLAFTFSVTNPKIIKLKEEQRNESMKIIIPQAQTYEEKKQNGMLTFIASTNEKELGKIYQVPWPGYGGTISMLVGIADGKVTAIEILDQKETPGLGTNIEEQWFKDQFKGKTAEDKLEPKQDIDALVGATISSRAVADGVKHALDEDAKSR